VIEAKLQVMLGSLPAHISRLDIEFDSARNERSGQVTYSCKLVVAESNGQPHVIYNQQPDANLAIEGAIARARRAISRLSRARANSWGQASPQ
jgi:ribosomal protein S5